MNTNTWCKWQIKVLKDGRLWKHVCLHVLYAWCMWFFVCLTDCVAFNYACVRSNEDCVREEGKEAGRQDVESIVCPTMKRSSLQESCVSVNGGINIWGQRAAMRACVCVGVSVWVCAFVSTALDTAGFSRHFFLSRLEKMQMSAWILQTTKLVFKHFSL